VFAKIVQAECRTKRTCSFLCWRAAYLRFFHAKVRQKSRNTE